MAVKPFAPEGRKYLAVGVSPRWPDSSLPSPSGAEETLGCGRRMSNGCAGPPGLFAGGDRFRGLTPPAKYCRPFGPYDKRPYKEHTEKVQNRFDI